MAVRMTKFNHLWLAETKYSSWLIAAESNNRNAKCKLCMSVIQLSNMGKRALEAHCKNKKHLEGESARESSSVAMICDGIDYLLLNEVPSRKDISKINVTKEMIKSCAGAGSKYNIHLAEQQSSKEKKNADCERTKIKKDICKEKKSVAQWGKVRERLSKEADDLATTAEKEKKMSMLSESNATRKRGSEYLGYIEKGKDNIAQLEKKLKACI